MERPQRVIVENRHSCGCGGCFTVFFLVGLVLVAADHWEVVVPIAVVAVGLAAGGWWLWSHQSPPAPRPRAGSQSDEEIAREWFRRE